jgi:hypothetical protein
MLVEGPVTIVADPAGCVKRQVARLSIRARPREVAGSSDYPATSDRG